MYSLFLEFAALRQSLWNEPDTKAKGSEKSISQGQKTPGMEEKSPTMPGVVFLKYLKVTRSASDLAKLIGVSQPHVTQLPNMLTLPPAEIEAIRFGTQ